MTRTSDKYKALLLANISDTEFARGCIYGVDSVASTMYRVRPRDVDEEINHLHELIVDRNMSIAKCKVNGMRHAKDGLADLLDRTERTAKDLVADIIVFKKASQKLQNIAARMAQQAQA